MPAKKTAKKVISEVSSDESSDSDIQSIEDIIETNNVPDNIVQDDILEDEVNDEVDVVSEEDEIEDDEALAIVKDVANDDDTCLYRFNKKKQPLIDDEDGNSVEEDVEEEYYEEEVSKVFVAPKDRITRPILYKYERVRILGTRTRQLTLGAKPMIKDIIHFDAKDIAKKELENKVVPIKIIRVLPSGKKELWYLNELKIIN
jgi:DNA-directed RNA polymerase I, II, and III subunit RPABC2